MKKIWLVCFVCLICLICLSDVAKAKSFDDYLRGYTHQENSDSRILFQEIYDMVSQGKAVILDVRLDDEKTIEIEGVNVTRIPINKLPDEYQTLPKDKLIITVCAGGARSMIARLYLITKGYNSRYAMYGIYDLKQGFALAK
ncbi:MAG: tRNA s(4)U8 sulfurtransferase [Alphaproteobacteria bacterium ADurb.Bin438]|nr:MAG: tRNA s(4)U8 sulfurtransferase [Alphaproteobacteria bacterium ADurb.Bin438]